MNLSREDLKILVTRTDRIGDLVISTPVFSAIRHKYPKAHIAALIFSENKDILEGNPFIDEVILYDKKSAQRGLLGQLFFAGKLRGKKFDVVVHLHATNRTHIAGFLAGIPARIGWDRRSPWTLTHVFRDQKAEGKKHEGEYNFDLLKPLGIEAPQRLEMFFPATPRAEASLNELLFQLAIPRGKAAVVLNPSASCPSKRWPAERFAELADLITGRCGAAVFLIGGAADEVLSAKIKDLCKSPVYDFTGRLSLSMLGSLLKKTALLISNDTGPVHIAAAVGTPVVSIFGRNQAGLSPARWRPLGEQVRIVWKDVGCTVCLAHNCQIAFLCLTEISAEEVLASAVSFPESLWDKKFHYGVSDSAEA